MKFIKGLFVIATIMFVMASCGSGLTETSTDTAVETSTETSGDIQTTSTETVN